MLTFKTQFPLDDSKTIDDLLECSRIWLMGSPHSELSSQLKDTKLQEGSSFSSRYESLNCSVFGDIETEIGGIRYEKREDGEIRWLTEVVGSKSSTGFIVAVQLSVDSELPVERLDQGKRPHILKSLMKHIGGGIDGVLKVSDTPIRIQEHDLHLAADIICGRTSCAMPVVYVSANRENRPFIDVDQVSKWLSGMAHVVIEPSRSFSFKLMHEVYNENAYGGAVGIYWPDGIGKWLLLPSGKHAEAKEMQAAVIRKVRTSLLSQRTKKECTWSYLSELIARRRLLDLRKSGTGDIEEYIRHFDAEISSKNEDIRRLEMELTRTRYARQLIVSSTNQSVSSVLLASGERDLYQAERLDILMDALKSAAEAAEPHSRRWDVLRDIADQNNNSGEREEILERLKHMLRQYDSMTSSKKAEFESLGFEIKEDGKHYKLLYRGDARYPFILPKTGSDWRGGLNAFSDLRRRIF